MAAEPLSLLDLCTLAGLSVEAEDYKGAANAMYRIGAWVRDSTRGRAQKAAPDLRAEDVQTLHAVIAIEQAGEKPTDVRVAQALMVSRSSIARRRERLETLGYLHRPTGTQRMGPRLTQKARKAIADASTTKPASSSEP